MKSKNRFTETYLFSTVGIAAMAVLLVALNVVVGAFSGRLDLTEEKLYTLSKGTRAILKELDSPMEIRFYYSKDAAQMPVYLKNYARRVEDLLKEYRQASGGKLVVKMLDPQPDTDAEDSANLDGVTGQMIGLQDTVYLGLAISFLDETVSIPFLSPDRETLLEYDLTRAVYRLQHPEKPVVGIMSSLPVMGGVSPQQAMMPNMRRQQTPAWLFVSELKKDFEVREVETDAEAIASDIDVLVLAHAKQLSDQTLFAIDQFVLRGGRLLAFLDPMSYVDMSLNPPQGGMPFGQAQPSTLDKLLDKWGVALDTTQVVADMTYKTRMGAQGGDVSETLPVLSLNRQAVNADDPSISQLENLILPFVGAFTGEGASGMERLVLLRSSRESQLVSSMSAQMSGQYLVNQFKPSGKEQALAVRLSGTFKTAFPKGLETDEKDVSKADTLQEGSSAVVLVADSDLLYDSFCVQYRNAFFGQRVAMPISDNLNLVQNLVEQLGGDDRLLSIRSRGALRRPFEVVNRMQAEAQQRYQAKIQKLEEELAEAERKLGELQRHKSQDQKMIISQEQREEIARFQESRARIRVELKEVRKELRRDINALENRLKWANITLMPLLVSLGGIALAVVRRRRMVKK